MSLIHDVRGVGDYSCGLRLASGRSFKLKDVAGIYQGLSDIIDTFGQEPLRCG